MTLYEMLTGVSAFSGKDPLSLISQQIGTPTPPMKTVAPAVSVPASIEAVVMRLTEKEPEKRYADAAAVLDALADVASQEGIALGDAASGATRSTPRAVPPLRGAEAAGQTVASAELLSIGGTVPDVKAAAGAAPVADASPPPAPILPGGASARAGTDLVEGAKQRLPLRPRALWILVPLLGLLLLVVLRVASRPATSPVSSSPAARKAAGAVKRASREQIKQAAEAGLPDVLRLVEQYPQDARAHRLLGHMYMAQDDGVQALRALATAVELDGAAVMNGEIVQAVTQAAKAADSLDAALGLLASRFGARGVDVLYALAFRPGPARIKAQARQRLEQPQVRSKASAAAAVAIELHAASTCEDKQRLLPRAAKDGDARVLQQLKALQQTYNCGPLGALDCWSCLRQGTALRDAIAAVEARPSSR